MIDVCIKAWLHEKSMNARVQMAKRRALRQRGYMRDMIAKKIAIKVGIKNQKQERPCHGIYRCRGIYKQSVNNLGNDKS